MIVGRDDRNDGDSAKETTTIKPSPLVLAPNARQKFSWLDFQDSCCKASRIVVAVNFCI